MTNRKKFLFVAAITLVILLLGNFVDSILPLNGPNTTTIDEGTVGGFKDVSIGVGNVWDGSATLFLSEATDEAGEKKRVRRGDQFTFQQYDLEVLKVREGFWPIGIGRGSVSLQGFEIEL